MPGGLVRAHVKTAGFDAPVKKRGPANPAAPSDLKALGDMAAAPNKIASFFALGVMVIVRGGIRFEHSCRSKLLSCDASGAWFWCSEGKARKNGQKAPPFKFFVPEVLEQSGPFPAGSVGRFCKRWKKAFEDKVNFLVPALYPSKASVSSATHLRWKPMTLSAFNKNLWAVSAYASELLGDGGPAAKRTSYSLRRLAPSLANTCGLPIHERRPFGNWTWGGSRPH